MGYAVLFWTTTEAAAVADRVRAKTPYISWARRVSEEEAVRPHVCLLPVAYCTASKLRPATQLSNSKLGYHNVTCFIHGNRSVRDADISP